MPSPRFRSTPSVAGRRWSAVVACMALTMLGLVVPAIPAVAADPVRLSVTTVNSDPYIESGDSFFMRTTITNTGTVPVQGLRIFERAPEGFGPVDGFWPDGTSLSFLVLTLEPGASTVYTQWLFGEGEPGFTSTYAINVSSEQPGEQVVVTTPCSPGSLNSCADVTIAGPSQLSLTVQADRQTAEPGDLITYTILVTPESGGSDGGLEVRDILPDGVTYVSASPAPGSVESGSGVPGHEAVVNWSPVPIGPTTPLEYLLTVRVDEDVADSSLVNNVRAFTETAVVADLSPCSDPGFWPTGGSCVTTTVGTAPTATLDSALQACVLPSPTLCNPAQDRWWVDDATLPSEGKVVFYRLLLTNAGQTLLTDVHAGVTLYGGQVGNRSGNKVSQGWAVFPEWTVGSLQPGERASWRFSAQLPASLGPIAGFSGASALSGETATVAGSSDGQTVTVATNEDFAESVLGRLDSAGVIAAVRAWLAAHR